jgi:hypothetical protein
VLAGPAGAVTDSFGGVAFYPFTTDPSNADCIPWTEPGVGPTRNCDPINLIFPGQSLADVVASLHAAGWIDTGGSVQWLHFASSVPVPVEWQLAIYDGSDPTQRYHVRLWEAAPGLTIGNVHHEHGTPHGIDMAWDDAEAFLARGVCAWWCGQIYLPEQDAIQFDSGAWRGWRNDAYATVIPKGPPAQVMTPPSQPVQRRHRRHAPRAAKT